MNEPQKTVIHHRKLLLLSRYEVVGGV